MPSCTQSFNRAERPGAKLARNRLCAREVFIHDPDKINPLRIFCRQIAIHARMIASKRPRSHHSYPQHPIFRSHLAIVLHRVAYALRRSNPGVEYAFRRTYKIRPILLVSLGTAIPRGQSRPTCRCPLTAPLKWCSTQTLRASTA